MSAQKSQMPLKQMVFYICIMPINRSSYRALRQTGTAGQKGGGGFYYRLHKSPFTAFRWSLPSTALQHPAKARAILTGNCLPQRKLFVALRGRNQSFADCDWHIGQHAFSKDNEREQLQFSIYTPPSHLRAAQTAARRVWSDPVWQRNQQAPLRPAGPSHQKLVIQLLEEELDKINRKLKPPRPPKRFNRWPRSYTSARWLSFSAICLKLAPATRNCFRPAAP